MKEAAKLRAGMGVTIAKRGEILAWETMAETKQVIHQE